MTNDDNLVGVILRDAPSDWQVIQQDQQGMGKLSLRGQWFSDLPGMVEARLVSENTGVLTTQSLDWQAAITHPNGSWAMTLEQIPAGGPYRLETRLNCAHGSADGVWDMRRGDTRHFLGVGDLWVIAGQSNAAGSANGPAPDAPRMGIHTRRPSGQWALATHPLNDATATQHPAQLDTAGAGHSPWLRFGALLHEQLGYPIGLLPTALGGSPLSAWNPTDHDHPDEAHLFQNMLQVIACAGGHVRGIVWYQGEAEANAQDAPTYGARFSAMVAAWRAALQAPDLPVLTAQLNRSYQTADEGGQQGWSILREAQRQAAQQVVHVAVVPTGDLPLCDHIHTSPAGNMALAQRFADVALGGVYGQPRAYHAPDVQSARYQQEAGGTRLIELTFAHVTSRLETIDSTSCPFDVVDANGVVAITTVRYRGTATIELLLTRALVGTATVAGGAGINPALMPIDAERRLPALAFSGVPVEAVPQS